MFTIGSINQNLLFKPARHTKNMEITTGLLKEKFDQVAIVYGAAKLHNSPQLFESTFCQQHKYVPRPKVEVCSVEEGSSTCCRSITMYGILLNIARV